jgi:colanic acid/amylovoran biosynthesis protein
MPCASTSKPLQILLVNGWSDDNKGDCAIVEGLVRLVRAEAPTAEIGIVSSFALTGEELSEHYRFTAKSGDVRVYVPLLVSSRLQSQARQWLPRRVWSLIASMLLLLVAPVLLTRIGRHLLPPAKRELLAKFAGADVVISKGGHIFVSDGSFSGLLGLYLYLYPLLLALRLGKRAVLYGQSIGPVPDRLGRALLKATLRRCRGILTREELSRDFVRALLQEPHAGLGLCWDTAFAVQRAPLPTTVLDILPANYAVMTVRQWEFPGLPAQEASARYSTYLRAMASTIDYLWEVHRLPVVLAPQVIGPSELENDYQAWSDLLPMIVNRSALIAVHADLSPGQLMDLYGRAKILLGTRFHSVILGLAAGTPSAAVSYYGFKTRGIMRMLGFESLVVEIASLNQRDLEVAVETLLATEDQHRELLASRVPAILDDCVRTLRSVLYGTVREDESELCGGTKRSSIAQLPQS